MSNMKKSPAAPLLAAAADQDVKLPRPAREHQS
jgi:hypothetical protein